MGISMFSPSWRAHGRHWLHRHRTRQSVRSGCGASPAKQCADQHACAHTGWCSLGSAWNQSVHSSTIPDSTACTIDPFAQCRLTAVHLPVVIRKNRYGAKHIATATTGEGFAFVRSLGATFVTDYTKEDIFDVLPDNSVDIVCVWRCRSAAHADHAMQCRLTAALRHSLCSR